MKLRKVLITLTLLCTLSVMSAACNNSPETTLPTENPSTTSETSSSDQEQATQVPGSPEVKSTGVPEDVPVHPDAYELQVASQKNLSYKVALSIQDIVEFYQQEFSNYGWDVVNNPDSVVGSMAQISRSNAKGDRLIFSMQYNPIGEFTLVQIYITRTP